MNVITWVNWTLFEQVMQARALERQREGLWRDGSTPTIPWRPAPEYGLWRALRTVER